MKRGIVVLSFLIWTTGFAIEPVSIIVRQVESPIKILDYSAKYPHEAFGKPSIDEISHKLEYENIGDKFIVAIRFKFISFNVFNEYLDSFHVYAIENIATKLEERREKREEGYTVKVPIKKKETWGQNCYEDFTFLTGIVFVEKVRFEDGTFWKANYDEVMAEVEKIQQNFDKNLLLKESKPDSEN